MRIIMPPINNKKYLKSITLLDRLVFEEIDCSSIEIDNARHHKNRHSIILLEDKNEIIGYLNAYPIIKTLYHKMKNGEYYDDILLSPSEIKEYACNNHYDMYIMAIVLHPSYQKMGYSKLLRKAFREMVNELKKDKIYIDRFISIAITIEGERFLKSLGMKVICENKEKRKILELEGELLNEKY